MKDNLEEFIREHRDEFDSYTPAENMWPIVDKKLRHKHRRIGKTYYAATASLLLILGSFLWFMKHTDTRNIPQVSQEVVVTPEIKDAEVYYTSLVETKRTEVKQMCTAYPDVCKDFEAEIDTLHALYGQLKIEYKNSNGNEAVLQAMIQNLQMQVQLLSTQFQVIQNIKQRERKGNQNSKLM